jgi:hypothetical protein
MFGNNASSAHIDLRLDASIGAPAAGSRIHVHSFGLKPDSVVTVTVFSEPVVIATATANSNGEVALNTALPSGLAEGTHSIVVSAVGAAGQEVKILNPLKIDSSGLVTEVGQPGDAVGVNPDGNLVERSLALNAPVYSPSAHPGTVAAVAVTGAAVVGVAGAAAGAASAAGHAASGAAHGAEASHAAAGLPKPFKTVFAAAGLAVAAADVAGLGDRSITWRAPGTHHVHDVLARIATATSRYSLILPRAMNDGTWARAMFGSSALLLWLAGFLVGVVNLFQTGFNAIPGSLGILLAIIVLGTLDAMAGLIAWATISIGALVTFHVRTLSDLLTIVGLGCLAISLSTFANCLRPLRRVGHTGLIGVWDRFADYVIPPVIVSFAAVGISKGLNGLSGLEIVDVNDLLAIQLVAGATIVLRLVLEDIVRKLYPQRCAQAAMPATAPPSSAWRLAAIACRTVITYLLISAFVGNSWLPLLASVLLAVPLVMGIYQDQLPRLGWMHRWLPSGITRIVLTTVVGVLLTAYLFTSPSVESLLPGLLVLLVVPAAILSSLHLVAKGGKGWSNVWPKRLLGVPMYILMVGLTTGAIVLVH